MIVLHVLKDTVLWLRFGYECTRCSTTRRLASMLCCVVTVWKAHFACVAVIHLYMRSIVAKCGRAHLAQGTQLVLC